MKIYQSMLVFIFFLVALTLQAELSTVTTVDIARYLGKWHEIARFDTKHQKGCVESTAEYSQKDGYIEVKNQCLLSDGKMKEVVGRAKVDDAISKAKLKVNFTPAFIRLFGVGWGNYWIIELGEHYEYAVVSEPKMEYLWILAREKPMKKELYASIIERLQRKGFKTENILLANNALRTSE